MSSCNKNIFPFRYTLFLLLFLSHPGLIFSQVFWTEDFNNGCTSNCLASTYAGTNGAWTVTLTGTNGTDANLWYVSCAENGYTNGICGSGCVPVSATATLATLHIGASSSSTGDVGAFYDFGGNCGVSTCPQTNLRAESPVINCTGRANINLSFNYIEGGDGTFDYASIWYYDGSTWYLLVNNPRTNNAGCGGRGQWTSYSISLPSSANNNPNVKVGFNWTNNDDGLGSSPSFAVDNLQLAESPNQPPTANFTTTITSFCQGTCISFTDLSTNTPATWSWVFQGANSISSTAQSPANICYNTPGTYDVSLIVTNANGSNNYTKSLYITVNANPSIIVSPNPPTICAGSSVLLTATGANSFTWSPLTGLSSTIGSSVTASPSVTSSYTVIGTTNGCTDTITCSVIVVPQLTADAGLNDTICRGSSTTLIASGGPFYSWSSSASLSCLNCPNPVATPTTTTTYTVSVSDGICPPSTDNVTVVVKPLPQPLIANNSPLCNSATLNLTAAGGVSFVWTGPYGFTSTSQYPAVTNVTTNNSGTYFVTITDAFGCTGMTTTTVTVHPNPIVNAGSNNPVCYSANILLTSSGGTTYQWSGPNGFHATIKNPVILSASTASSGTYIVTVTNSYSCTAVGITAVNVLSKITLTTPASLHLCPNAVTMIAPVVSGAIAPIIYYWNNYISSATHVFSLVNDSIFSFHVVDANGCKSDTNYTNIHVYKSVNINLSYTADSICPGSATNINATISPGSLGPYTIYFEGGSIFVPPVTVRPASTTTYIISAKDDCGTIDQDTAVIKVSQIPSLSFTPTITEGCVPAVVTFQQPVVSQQCTYKWDFGDFGPNHVSYSTNPTYGYYNSGVYDVTLTVTTPNGCSYSNTLNDLITVYPKPTARFSADPQNSSIINPQIEFFNSSINADKYYWYFSNGDTSYLENPEILFSSIGSYIVELVVESNKGCLDTSTLTVNVNDEYTFYAPNAFTPNNDGFNDTFFVKGNGINPLNFNMYIFDRWGELIWETDKYDADHPEKYGWDGKINNISMGKPGIYVWYIIYRDIKDKTHKKTGTVTLIN